MTVINARTSTVTATIPVGSFPIGIAVNPLTGTVYVTSGVTNHYHGGVSVISGRTNTVTGTVELGGEPEGIDVDVLTGAVYVANYDNADVAVISDYGRRL